MPSYIVKDLETTYTKQFHSIEEARHWVINHLDLSKKPYIECANCNHYMCNGYNCAKTEKD